MPDRTWTIDVDRRTCAVCGTVERSFADCGFEEGSSSEACWEALKHVQCVRCGHEPCEGCMDWCDLLVCTDNDSDLCCDGECLYPGDPVPAGKDGLAAEERRIAGDMGISVETLYRNHRAVPCPCDEDDCSGWRIVPRAGSPA